MSANQYRYLRNHLLDANNGSLLVFGLGHDSLLWSECVSGELAFIEDNPTYLSLAPVASRVVLHRFASQVGKRLPTPPVPQLINRPWDFVLVDGPAGFSRNSPGRQFSIDWARQLAIKQVFVHDYERPWERTLCDQNFGKPTHVLEPTGKRRGQLATFSMSGHSPGNELKSPSS